MTILIKAAKVIDAKSPYNGTQQDILIIDGIITEIGKNLSNKNATVVSSNNLYVSRGWFDSSVSFGEPGFEERETLKHGLETASKSGFTRIALNSNTNPPLDTHASVAHVISESKKNPTYLHPIANLTVGGNSEQLAELYDLKNAGAVGFGDYKQELSNPNQLKIALQYSQHLNALIMAFPQNKSLTRNGIIHEGKLSTSLGVQGIPSLAEEIQIARDIAILEYTGGKLHIPTVSTKKSVALIENAKKSGLDVSCSVAIHNLCFTDQQLESFDTRYKVQPPLRSETDRKALIKGVKKGIIDFVTSDHCPIDIDHKKMEIDHAEYGTIGLETAFGALLNHFSLEETIELLTKGKERFSMENHAIEVGETAELTLFTTIKPTPFSSSDIVSTSKNSAFLGYLMKGTSLGIVSKGMLSLKQ
jgi:dihydroorotase